MSFASNTSRKLAQSTVAKLFENVLPNSTLAVPADDTHLSSTQLLSRQLNTKVTKSKKKSAKSSQKIKKQMEQDKKFNKMIKYNIIKGHEDHSPEELKYLAKLRRKNINQINNVSNIDDEDILHELDELRSSLLDNELISKQPKKRLRGKYVGETRHAKYQDFDSKIKRGLISYPGLTPGLAPVDYNESDSE
ncbi:regulator of rDNA transcription 14 [Suhomyces tanzawaensis NRRL Y-17324]|uniref:Regulator of rDNA transcription 14 n=1 Tax=Suhomyces tanzawaensis NRRL Y-17324 TaxID=984487 RepID=A0A1E4SB50_9ASCO|nr:regulator of rDNA transcription 14 [Suhomyces tanzawaensis NRRL Y-17324]ODV76750.1 regulator of rDNA transcription 14 [Suhomyces tanzawaensis NRRL Y-17324]